MVTTVLAALWQALTTATSRRGVIAGLGGGLLAAGPLALTSNMAAARKKGKKKRKNKKRKNAKGKTRRDATCSAPVLSGAGSSTSGDVRVAQTFVAGTRGALVKAEIPIVKEPGTFGEYLLRLSPVNESGVPTNDVLAESAVSNLRVPEGESVVTFTFSDPATVVAGKEYALVLTRPGSTSLVWQGNLDDPCSGRGFVSGDQTAEFVDGPTDVDLIFTTFVRS